jgi:hypothetical protein
MRFKVVMVAAVLVAGCTLYSDVTINPLNLMPSNISRGSDLQSMLRRVDYLRAIQLAPTIDARPRQDPADLQALGEAFLAAGQFDEARKRLRAAVDLNPFHTIYAQIAWDLSQVEYLSNNYDASLDWAQIAKDHGLILKDWHMKYLEAMRNTRAYEIEGAQSQSIPMVFGHPDVPRIAATVNGTKQIEAVIDSGAVLSIISNRLAASLPVKELGDFEGTFFGLLGEPIQVRFGLLESLTLEGMTIRNVPVAIMPDEKMKFLINRRSEEFNIDFLLGSNLLKEFRLELDFDRQRATFTHVHAGDRQTDAEQNMFFNNFRPYVRGSINRKAWYLFVLDTGSEITFLNETHLASLPVASFGSAHKATLQGLGGSMKHGGKLEDVEIGVGRWAGTFKTLPMYETSDREEAVGIVGQNFLKNFNVVIDFGKMRVEMNRR